MFSTHAYHGYRILTPNEQLEATAAIKWLLKLHIKPQQIALMQTDQIDRELHTIKIEREFRWFTLERVIGYQGTPLGSYLDSTFPNLKSRDWLFPTSAWLGKNPSYGFHVHADLVEKFAENRHKKLLISHKQHANIRVTAIKSNITKQKQVGRRTALRA